MRDTVDLAIDSIRISISAKYLNLNLSFSKSVKLVLPNTYRLQLSCGKVMLSQASVILFTAEVYTSMHWADTPLGRQHSWADPHPGRQPLGQTPPSRHTPWADTPTQCMLGYTLPVQCMQRTVCILLECILVFLSNGTTLNNSLSCLKPTLGACFAGY